jgi:hypothetical protein
MGNSNEYMREYMRARRAAAKANGTTATPAAGTPRAARQSAASTSETEPAISWNLDTIPEWGLAAFAIGMLLALAVLPPLLIGYAANKSARHAANNEPDRTGYNHYQG